MLSVAVSDRSFFPFMSKITFAAAATTLMFNRTMLLGFGVGVIGKFFVKMFPRRVGDETHLSRKSEFEIYVGFNHARSPQ